MNACSIMQIRPIHLLSYIAILAISQLTLCTEAQTPAVKDLNTPREFPKITTQRQWQERAEAIRQQILVSAGLWPLPEKTPLKAKIFGKVERNGYSVEKVYFQTYPGFYLAGNLYRPLGRGTGPFPAILNPHGHWANGRMADTQDGSIAARCINFAKQGMIAFSYDMVGYNDTHFPESPITTDFYKVHRDFGTNDPANLLWSISLMGLQTWNSIRALDFLESLPGVDKHRLACTGESGGGTQTFILGAIDDRLAAQAPVVMVSHTMQGGCGCENMPGLRIEYSNMEIAAAAAPRPQIMVAAAGDWTKTMPTVEGPAVEGIYELFHAKEKLRHVRFDFNHNYNQTSREAVYQWFDHWLLDTPDAPIKEVAYQKESDETLRVFTDGKLPSDAVSQSELIQYLVKTRQTQLQALEPKSKSAWEHYKKIIEPAWKRTLQLEYPNSATHTFQSFIQKNENYSSEWLEVNRINEEKKLKLLHFKPAKTNSSSWPVLVVLVNPEGKGAYCNESGAPVGLAKQLLDHKLDVIIVDKFPSLPSNDQYSIFYSTYNRTYLQERVRDLITICHGVADIQFKSTRVVLCGTGHAGLWSLLATPATDAVVADYDQLNLADDKSLLAPDLFCPGLRNIDSFIGPAILAAPKPLLLHNVASTFSTQKLQSAYRALNAEKKLCLESARMDETQIADWIIKLNDSK
jgi:Acetyl xylan esterase (AXE1)